MQELAIPPETDLSQVPKGEHPYLRKIGNATITNLSGDLVKLRSVIEACKGFGNKRFKHYEVLCCNAACWAFIFQHLAIIKRESIIAELLVAGYTIEIDRTKTSTPHISY